MKKKSAKRFRKLFLFLLLAGVAAGGWRVFEKPEAKMPAANSSFTVDSNDSDGDYEIIRMRKGDIHSGNLILINSQYAYQSDTNNLVSVFSRKNTAYKVKDKTVLLNEKVIAAFNDMMAEFNQVTSDNAVNVISGYRSESEQQVLLDDEIARKGQAAAAMWVAGPGFSEHHSGLALDLGLYFDNGTSASFDGKGKYAWIHENCWKYGFILRYPENKTQITNIFYEPWHLRYVGIPHAFLMKEKGLCFEEYIELLRKSQLEKKHLEVSVNGVGYEIYFTTKTDVSIPENSLYEISGNNVDGFIVTIIAN